MHWTGRWTAHLLPVGALTATVGTSSYLSPRSCVLRWYGRRPQPAWLVRSAPRRPPLYWPGVGPGCARWLRQWSCSCSAPSGVGWSTKWSGRNLELSYRLSSPLCTVASRPRRWP